MVARKSSSTIPMDVSSKKTKIRGKATRNKKDNIKRAKLKVDNGIDYISDLPDPVLHQILCHLHPKDAARTCILSKKWVQTWKSYQVLDFDLRCFQTMRKATKANYKHKMNLLLKRRKEQLLNFDKFRLIFVIEKDILPDVDRWIDAALKRNVREFEVQAKPSKSSHIYIVPSSVFCGRSITALNLSSCILPRNDFDVNLPLLEKISLKRINVAPKFLQRIFSGCPLIDELRLIECTGFRKLSIGAENRLKRVDLHKCDDLKKIVIENPRLETFWFFYDKRKLCNIDLSACGALKELVLEYPRMTEEVFEDLTLQFPVLEKLVLSRCHGLKSIKYSGDRLRKLEIRRCRKLAQAQFNTRNLDSLEYRGPTMPFSFLTPLCLKEVSLCFEQSTKSNWEAEGDDVCRLRSFFNDYDRFKGLKLLAITNQDIALYEDVRSMVPFSHHISKPHSIRTSACFTELLTSALKTCPFSSILSVISHGSSEFPEIIYKELSQGKGELNCCSYFKNKCWRHYLRDVSVENLISKDSPSNSESQKTTFTLRWNTAKKGAKRQTAQCGSKRNKM